MGIIISPCKMSVPTLQMQILSGYIDTQASLAELADIAKHVALVHQQQNEIVVKKFAEYYDELVKEAVTLSVPTPLVILAPVGHYMTRTRTIFQTEHDGDRFTYYKMGDGVKIVLDNVFDDECNIFITLNGKTTECNEFNFITTNNDAIKQILYWNTTILQKLNDYYMVLRSTRQ
jgi:hypothetical protein